MGDTILLEEESYVFIKKKLHIIAVNPLYYFRDGPDSSSR